MAKDSDGVVMVVFVPFDGKISSLPQRVAWYLSNKGLFPNDDFSDDFRPLTSASLKRQKITTGTNFRLLQVIIRKEMRFSHSKLLSISWLLQILLIPHPPHFLFRADFCIFTHENSISLIRLVHIYSHKQCAVIKNTIFFSS